MSRLTLFLTTFLLGCASLHPRDACSPVVRDLADAACETAAHELCEDETCLELSLLACELQARSAEIACEERCPDSE